MFEHLDDPTPFQPDERFHAAVVRRGRRMRSRRRLTVGVGALTLVLGTVGGAGALYVDRRDAAIDRVDVATVPGTDGATNILLVGSDRRSEDFDESDVVVEGARADTIAIVRLNEDGSVGVLGIPRDLRDPATGGRVNAHAGDPQRLIDAVNRVTGLPVDHFVQLDMEGFVDLVDDLGGIELAVDVPLHDPESGLALDPADCVTLDGEAALALARSRHVEGDAGDLDRMARGHAALSAVVVALAGAGTDPASLDGYSRILADHATVDDGLSLTRMVEIGGEIAAAGPAGVHSTILPVVPTQDPTAGVVLDLAPQATAVLLQFGAAPGSGATPGAGPSIVPPVGAAPIRPCG